MKSDGKLFSSTIPIVNSASQAICAAKKRPMRQSSQPEGRLKRLRKIMYSYLKGIIVLSD